MKKAILFVLCSILLLGCLTAAHADQQETQGTNAVDIVLLIDQSGSLWKTNSPSDPNGYRLDAAQMIIAMLSQDNGSRVAYVPFSGKVFESADKHFTTINCEDDYLDKMRQSELFRSESKAAGPKNENDYGTDYAEALAYACILLDNREDKTNKPMIILLTDGAMEIKDEVDKKVLDELDKELENKTFDDNYDESYRYNPNLTKDKLLAPELREKTSYGLLSVVVIILIQLQ